jgi:acetyl-CoA acetyltransferase
VAGSVTDRKESNMTESAKSPVIAGLGMTEMGKVFGRTASQFAGEAVRLAARDAGLALGEIDGLLISAGATNGVSLDLQRELRLEDLKLLSVMQAYGSTAAAMVQVASMAIQAGQADVVACVWADDPLRENGAMTAYGSAVSTPAGWMGLTAASGIVGANPMYALAARRHMERYGTTSKQLGAIAVAQRDWAVMNPLAQFRTPITMEDYLTSRWIAEPFHLLDCCLVSNGGIAVIVTSTERAKSLAQPPVHVLGWGQCHPGHFNTRNEDFGLVSGAVKSGPAALAMAGVSVADIDVVEFYDCYTYTVLITLEDYGFCEKGEGGPFVASGVLGPKGSLKLNTGGGQLSSYYMWGMTPLSEAVMQARGSAGERQVAKHDLVLVSGNGGVLDHHSTLVLGTSAS